MSLKPIPTFAKAAEAAAHFKAIHESRIIAGIRGDLAGVGEQCILTVMTKWSTLRALFYRRGIKVSTSGKPGNRLLTAKGFHEEYGVTNDW